MHDPSTVCVSVPSPLHEQLYYFLCARSATFQRHVSRSSFAAATARFWSPIHAHRRRGRPKYHKRQPICDSPATSVSPSDAVGIVEIDHLHKRRNPWPSSSLSLIVVGDTIGNAEATTLPVVGHVVARFAGGRSVCVVRLDVKCFRVTLEWWPLANTLGASASCAINIMDVIDWLNASAVDAAGFAAADHSVCVNLNRTRSASQIAGMQTEKTC